MPASYTPPNAEDQDPGDIFRGFEGLSALGIALTLASRGVAIFPCEPHSKSPATPHGFKDATADISLYDHPKLPGYVQGSGPDGSELFLADRRDNWGFEPGPAGLFVVDIDPKNGGDETWAEFEKRHGPVATLEVRTPSGGRHLYFRGTVPFTNKRLGRGIDTRCFGGYVILPGGRVAFEVDGVNRVGNYTWVDPEIPIAPLPAWIVEEIEAQIEAVAAGAGQAAFENWQAEGGEGGCFDFYLSLIGDHEGGQGFYDPMLRAVGAGVALGMATDAILDGLREAAHAADRRNHRLSEVRDRLSKMPGAIRSFQANDARRRREAEEQEDVEPFEEGQEDDDRFELAPKLEEAEPDETEPHTAQAQPEPEVADEPVPFSDASPAEEPEEPSDVTEEPAEDCAATNEGNSEEKTTAEPKPALAAIANLRTHIQTWLTQERSHAKTLTILQSAAGLGKTRTVLEEQQRAEREDQRRAEYEDEHSLVRLISELTESLRDQPEPERQRLVEEGLNARLLAENLADLPPPPLGKLACAAPRQRLAQEIQDVDRELRGEPEPQIPVLVGRNASNCRRFALVTKAQSKGFEPGSLCQRVLPSREVQRCPFFETCAYRANQAEVKDAGNIVIQHAHLAVSWLDSLALKSRKRMWIDEDPCQTFVITKEISVRQFRDLLITERDFAAAGPQTGITTEDLESLADLSRFLIAGLEPPGILTIEQLTVGGWSPEALRRAGHTREAVETWRRGGLNPSLTDEALDQVLDQVRKPPRRFADLFYRLADELVARDQGEIYSLGRDPRTDNIRLRGRVPTDTLPPNLLLTDATPSPEILNAIFPEYEQELIRVPIPRRAVITQVSEPVFSRHWLLKKGHLAEVTDWLKRLATYYRRLVVLTTKRIRCAITGEDPTAKLLDFFEIHGARIGHYGNIRGSNQFADCDALVILGRQQPAPEDIEEVAKAIWYDTDKPLRLARRDHSNSKCYTPEKRPYDMSDGSRVLGSVEVHPDPRCQAVLAAVRENELVQALDRARLIWGEPKDIYILCDIPLPGVKVDRLVPWDVLRGADRFGVALQEVWAAGERAFPLVAGWLVDRFANWKTENSANRWLKTNPGIADLKRQIELKSRKVHVSNKNTLLGSCTFLDPSTKSISWKEAGLVEYRLLPHRPGARRWSKAVILDGAEPRAALAAVLDVPVSAVELKGDTQPATEPTQASTGPPPPEPEPTPDPAAAEPPDPDDPQEAPPAKPPWSVPPQPEFILETPSRRCTWFLVDPRTDGRTKPLNFAAMLRDDPDEGRLLTAADLGSAPDEPLRWLTGLLLPRGVMSGQAGERVDPEPLRD